MPLKVNSNNKILPANSRAADVATQAIQEITPVQQARYYNAFRPQGIQCILYNLFKSGRKCSCQASRKQLNGKLGRDGKADEGLINQLITGDKSFSIDPYGTTIANRNPDVSSPLAPENQYQGVFDIVSDDDADFMFARPVDEPTVGDNGPVSPIDIDALVDDFDPAALGFMDAACPVCFGSGFIGGYSPFQGYRKVYAVNDVVLADGFIDVDERPWIGKTSGFSFVTNLPRGAIGVDVFRVLNGTKIVPSIIMIDGTLVDSPTKVLAFCDGRRHAVNITLDENVAAFTHIEMQFNVTTESTLFEFPRLTSSSDTSLLEQTEPFQIVLSPNVPHVEPMDIIAESMFGKTLIVQNANLWNTRNRNLLGMEVTVRVLQPMEVYRLLPFRNRVPMKDQSTNKIRDNVTGPRRT